MKNENTQKEDTQEGAATAENVEATEATEAVEEKGTPGAPVGTPNDTIAELLPAERISRSKALNIIRGQGIKCSQERMTVIMEAKYGAAPTKEERDAERAKAAAVKKEAADKVKAEKAKVKAEKDAKAKEEKDAKAELAAETKQKREDAKTAGKAEPTTEEKPSV